MEGSQQDPAAWFKESQLQSVFRNGSVPDWFHGIITRKKAEELLRLKPPGYFLIRVSESRIGYTLSYSTNERCRHFMIDAQGNGRYIMVGENKCHRSLQDLVEFHCKTPILPFNEVLTVACGQSSEEHADYAELLSPQRLRNFTSSVPPKNIQKATDSHPDPATPPAIPFRPNSLMDSKFIFPNNQPNRLHPSLAKDVTTPLPATITNKVQAESCPWNQPPKVPLRNNIAQKQNVVGSRTTNVPESSSVPSAGERKLFTSVQQLKFQELGPTVVTNLKSLTKKLQKKIHNPQENEYAEIIKGQKERFEAVENEYQEITEELKVGAPPQRHTDVRLNDQNPPLEYRLPPPFAPGY